MWEWGWTAPGEHDRLDALGRHPIGVMTAQAGHDMLIFVGTVPTRGRPARGGSDAWSLVS
jgi:hypothetical protein